MVNGLREIFARFLDLVLPKKEAVRELENMTAEEMRRRARRAPPVPTPDTFALFSYRDPLIKIAIWEVKFRGNRRIAGLLAELLHEEVLEILADLTHFKNFTDPILVPIPISHGRHRERGFNQCELLAEYLTKIDGGASFTVAMNVLEKIRETASQTKSAGRAARLKNLRGCFAVASVPHASESNRVRGRNILLLDDVITTGATIEEARRALISAGARMVVAIAVAH